MNFNCTEDLYERASYFYNNYKDKDKENIHKEAIKIVDYNNYNAFINKYKYNLEQINTSIILKASYYKYADISYWIHCHMNDVIYLKLHKSSKKQILDIGCGGGSFCLLCKATGHDIIGLDMDFVYYNDLCNCFNFNKYLYTIKKLELLPNLNVKFDLITIFWQKFDEYKDIYGKVSYWGINEWLFFINDLINNQLNINGELYIKLNKIRRESINKCNFEFNIELLNLFNKNKAIVNFTKGEIFFKKITNNCLFQL